MKILATLVLLSLSVAARADVVLTKSSHFGAYMQGTTEIPARDTKQVLWFGKDRARLEEDGKVTIVRLDLKKAWVLNTKDKTASTLDVPIDIGKHIPPEVAKEIDRHYGGAKAEITPTEETKKIGQWTARKHTFRLSIAAGGYDSEIWTTNELALERETYLELMGHIVRTKLGGAAVSEAMKQLLGVPVLIERVQKVGEQTVRSREELVSVETKDPPADHYDRPADYVDAPFNPFPESARAATPAPAPEKKPEPR